MRVSDRYKLGLRQAQLDFVDVDIDSDLPVFIDPRALLLLNTEWGQECVALVQDFFQAVLNAIRSGNQARAQSLLGQLHEPNETRLGFSKGRPAGHALGPFMAGRIRTALTASEAVQTGLLSHLEDTILMIEGIGPDLISDITTNVIREPLARYTQQMAEQHGIPLETDVYPGPFWDPEKSRWHQEFVSLPKPRRPLLLVPKAIVRSRMDYDDAEYYDDYLIPHLREAEFADPRSSLVETLKNKTVRVTKKSLMEKFGRGKRIIEKLTRKNPEVLDRYRAAKGRKIAPPLDHAGIDAVTGQSELNWGAALDRVLKIKPGRDTASDFHNAAMDLLTPLFYPALSMPKKELPIHGGRKRIDITYANGASRGFFDWLRKNHEASHVFVECKNYTGDPANPELDQLAGRFGRERGRFGILLCRSFTDKALFIQRCRDTALDGRGFIIALDDDDLRMLVEARKTDDPHADLLQLKERFNELVM